MNAERNFIFFENESSAKTSEVLLPKMADVMSLQVEGTATSFTIVVEGINDFRAQNYYQLAIFNLSNIAKLSEISEKGLYEIGIEGVCAVRVKITAISGGNVSVYGRSVNTGV